ncbi:MAG: hypothetical protein JW801_15750 [Bacteroidales bacterium]|nr:hypothetical protein [Bacteroidales bacterium]
MKIYPANRRKKFFRAAMLSCLLCLAIVPRGYSNYNQQIYRAYIDGKIRDWIDVICRIETNPCNSEICKLELISYYYGFIGYLIGEKDHALALEYIDKGEQLLTSILSESPGNATANAYMGAFLGFRMTIDKYKMPVLGPKSQKYIDHALHLNPDNLQAIIEKANALYFAPEVLGGSKKEAIHYYIRALRLMEKNQETDSNWLYMKTLADLVIAYEATEHAEEALKLCRRILSLEPGFLLVKQELYPELLKKTGGK